jgi:2,3-bisphosphoglycerate-independent phosphoglycerate mutase
MSVMQKLIKKLIRKNDSRIIFVILDGLGGLPVKGETELMSLAFANAGRLKKFGA